MSDDNKIKPFAEAIGALLTDGIGLTGDVLHYLNSVAGVQSPDELETLLTGAEDCDGQSLYELIFFPDETQQIQIEPWTANAAFTAAEVNGLIERLRKSNVEATLHFPESEGSCRIHVPADAVSMFIRRLHLDRPIDSQVDTAMAGHIESRAMYLRLRVKLRNARFAFSADTSSFICGFVAHIAEDDPDFTALFDFAVDTLERIAPETDIYLALMDRKRHCGEMIRKARQNDQNLRQLPVEALILKGINISCINIDDAYRQMEFIDRISLAVFGKTELAENGMAEAQQPVDFGQFDRNTDIDKVIKILS
ncbi:MAG: hypothetical protein ACQERN_03870 [Thermodesulfobacteriota bacterium]